jgi:hypothetical protein
MDNNGVIIGKHLPFRTIDGQFCRVRSFLPLAKIDAKGVVRSASVTMPYAVLDLESPKLPNEKSCFYGVDNKDDFRHVFEAFNEFDSSTQEVIIVYQNNPYQYQNVLFRIFKKALPKLHVFIYLKGGLEKLYHHGSGEAGFKEWHDMKIKEWKPIDEYS